MFLLVLGPFALSAHSGEEHQKNKMESAPSPEGLKKVNEHYLKQVKPIFKKKCFSCHGSGVDLPWYAVIPGPKQLMEWDIKKAKKHLDFSRDFPFVSHATPKKDLQAILKMVREGSMPPLRFLLMHWDGALTLEEDQVIQAWAKKSLLQLQQTP